MSARQKIIPPPPSIDLLMHSLKHHAPDPNSYAVCKNPFEEINASEELAKSARVLEYDSEPDTDTEDALYETQWGDHDLECPDTQTIDKEMEYSEIVDRAEVFTEDEILKLSIEKANKLHSLYCNQLDQLKQMYIDRKRQYLQELKKEKELYCSIHKQKKTSLDEMGKYTQLKALLAYGRKHRVDFILAKRQEEKKFVSTSRGNKAKKSYTCCYQDDGVKCFNTCVPVTKYCARHILIDKRQVLFRPCGAAFNTTHCENPVLVTTQDEHCVFHTTFQATLARKAKEEKARAERERREEEEEENARLEAERKDREEKERVRLEEMKQEMADLISIPSAGDDNVKEEVKQDDLDVEVKQEGDSNDTKSGTKLEAEVKTQDLKENVKDVTLNTSLEVDVEKMDEKEDVKEEVVEESVVMEEMHEEVLDDQIVEVE